MKFASLRLRSITVALGLTASLMTFAACSSSVDNPFDGLTPIPQEGADGSLPPTAGLCDPTLPMNGKMFGTDWKGVSAAAWYTSKPGVVSVILHDAGVDPCHASSLSKRTIGFSVKAQPGTTYFSTAGYDTGAVFYDEDHGQNVGTKGSVTIGSVDGTGRMTGSFNVEIDEQNAACGTLDITYCH